MAKPLRVAVASAWCHVMNRAHRGEAWYLEDADQRQFLGAVAELSERYGLEVHAFVLMEIIITWWCGPGPKNVLNAGTMD